jgi:hypothetical protein
MVERGDDISWNSWAIVNNQLRPEWRSGSATNDDETAYKSNRRVMSANLYRHRCSPPSPNADTTNGS